MLDFAYKYKDQLKELYLKNVVGNEKYKYWNYRSYWDFEYIDSLLQKTTWNDLIKVSIFDSKIYGLFSCDIDRASLALTSVHALNFYLDKISIGFIRDFEEFVTSLFEKDKFNKIEFSVILGNPAEKLYDSFIKKWNGCVVGTFHKTTKLVDGELYDKKMYEIFREDYLKSEYYKNKEKKFDNSNCR